MREIWAITVKDLQEAFHNKLIISILLGTGVTLLTTGPFSMILRNQAEPLLVILDTSNSDSIRQLFDQPDLSVALVRSQPEMEMLLCRPHEVGLGLVVPEDFDAKIREGANLTLQGYTAHWISEQTRSELAILLTDRLEEVTGRAVEIEIQGQIVYPTLESVEEIGLSLIMVVMVATVIGLSLVPLMIVEEKLSHTMEALIVSPANMMQIFLGKTLSGTLLCLTALSLAVLTIQDMVVHWTVLGLAILLSIVFPVITGLLLGIIADNPATLSLWRSVIMLAILGLMFVKSLFDTPLPSILAEIATWTPGSLMLKLFGLSMVGTLPLEWVIYSASGLALFSLIIAAVVIWRLQRFERA